MFAGAWRIRRIKMIETSLINHEMTLPDTHVAEAFRALVSRPVPHTIPDHPLRIQPQSELAAFPPDPCGFPRVT